MSVMVTGATGLIGAGLVRMLLERGTEEIIAFHRNPARKNLDDVKDRISIVRGDLGTFSHVLEAVRDYRPRVIFHLGAMLTALTDADPPAAFYTNVAGTFHVLEAARLFGVGQVLFASSIGSYGLDIQGDVADDYTIQRPVSMYGTSKLFGESLGRYYRERYGLDFRCLRYPGIFGPGFRTPSLAQIFSTMVENSVMGKPSTLRMAPDVKHGLLYFKDAARAMIQLAGAPKEDVRRVCYLLSGAKPVPTARERVEMLKARIPDAVIDFDPDPELTKAYDSLPSFDDHVARGEWGWEPGYDSERSMDDFIDEVRRHPERYP